MTAPSTNGNGCFPHDARGAAALYLSRGRSPIPLPSASKRPLLDGWQNLRPTASDLDTLFPPGRDSNIGLLLGSASNGLVDIDLDAAETRSIADEFLPPTDWISGRAGSPRCHRWYQCNDAPAKASIAYTDPLETEESGRRTLVEFRSTGGQTVAPPGTHPSGEQIVWYEFGEPARVEAAVLSKCVARLGAAALLVRYWPRKAGTRQDAALGIAGGLLRAGWGVKEVEDFIRAAVTAAGDDEVEKRVETVARTAEKQTKREKTTGWPKAAEALGRAGQEVVKAVREWLCPEPVRGADLTPEPPAWPDPPGEEAFHGLAGRIVRLIEPASEADPAALLVQVLVAFGNAAGRGAHLIIESDHHRGNEFVVLVGRSSKARKGTSWGRVSRLFAEAAAQWAEDRVQTGLSSGEGLIYAVRDPATKREKVTPERGKPPVYVEVEADPGVADKRLLIHEPEFANVLKQTERQGNTLSAVLRLAWDGRPLRTLTKNSPTKATGAFVSLVGHITADELRRYLTVTESANGFGNRHLFVCVDRSKVLPEGGRVDPDQWQGVVREAAEALAFASNVDEVRRSEEARALWREIYPELSEGKPGLAGALLARGEAHVMRLALLYALLDQSPEIRAPHLLAALALWDYCERSVRFVFGDSLGDPVADELLRLLRGSPDGLTRTDISNYFQRHASSERVSRALGLLLQFVLARCERQETGGRPTERWFAASPKGR
jgi:hypothetical protein